VRRCRRHQGKLEELGGACIAPEDNGLWREGTQLQRVRQKGMQPELRCDAPLQLPLHARRRSAAVEKAREDTLRGGSHGLIEGLAQPQLARRGVFVSGGAR